MLLYILLFIIYIYASIWFTIARYAAEQGSPHRILTPESRPQIPLEGEWMHMDVMECVSHHRTSALSASVSTEYDPSLPPKKCSIHMLKWVSTMYYVVPFLLYNQ